MAELATIARPYAEALFKVARADLAATQGWLDGLAGAAGSDELLQFAANPKAGADQVYQLVSGVLGKPLPERGANFLRTHPVARKNHPARPGSKSSQCTQNLSLKYGLEGAGYGTACSAVQCSAAVQCSVAVQCSASCGCRRPRLSGVHCRA